MSSNDPFDLTYDFDNVAYDQLARDAEVDDRVGDHLFLITEIERGAWDDGQPRLKVKGNLVTANNSMADWTFSPPPSPEEIAAQKGTWTQNKKKAIASTINLVKQLGEHYGKSPGKLQAGDELKVKTAKTRVDNTTGKGGFIRIIAFLPKDHAVNGTPASTSDVPF